MIRRRDNLILPKLKSENLQVPLIKSIPTYLYATHKRTQLIWGTRKTTDQNGINQTYFKNYYRN